MPIALTYEEVKALEPCPDAFEQATKLLGGEGWGGRKIDAAAARAAGCTLDDIAWVVSALARKDVDVERRLRLWAADCAARVLHIYEKAEANGAPRNAIIAARQFARGEIDKAALAAAWATSRDAASAAAYAASAAAWAVWATSRDAASAAAYAASAAAWAVWAAAWAASAAAWAASAAAYAAWATSRDAAWAAAWDAEKRWQLDRLVAWLSDNEPEDWPLPKRPVVAAA